MSNQSKIYKLFPDYLINNDNFRSFIDIIADEYDTISNDISSLPMISQIANSPEEFLDYLGYIYNYKTIDSEDLEVQRDIIRRIFQAYSERGREVSLLKSAARANDPNWYREDLTYYNGPLDQEPVSVDYPQYNMFTWNRSTYSQEYRYPESTYWSDGVIIFNMTNMTNATRKAIEATIPAGRRYYLRNTIAIVDMNNKLLALVFDYTVYDNQNIVYFMRLREKTTGIELSINNKWNEAKWSGREVVSKYVDISYMSLTSALPNFPEIPNVLNTFARFPVDDEISIYDKSANHDLTKLSEQDEIRVLGRAVGLKSLSQNYRWSSNNAMSGASVGTIEIEYKIQPIHPTDLCYNLTEILDSKIYGTRNPSNLSGVEVALIKDKSITIDSNNDNSVGVIYDGNESSTISTISS